MSGTSVGAPVPLERGAFVVSIDTELAWGEMHRRDGSGGKHHFAAERACERLKAPARGERWFCFGVQFAQCIERAVEPRRFAGRRIMPAAAEQNDINARQFRWCRCGFEHADRADLLGRSVQRSREAANFLRDHWVIVVAHLQQKIANAVEHGTLAPVK